MLRTAHIEDFACADSPGGELFQAGSISKAVTALVALLLVDDGVLDLDADTDGATLRQLLSHTSGAGLEFFPGTSAVQTCPRSPTRAPRSSSTRPRQGGSATPAGATSSSSSLLEEATGKPFFVLAEERVLAPLGMCDSTDWHVYSEAAAAGLWTTPVDLARFALSVQRALADRRGPVPPRVASLMVEPQAEIPASEDTDAIRSLGIAPPEAMGLGLFLADGGRRFGHLGGNHGFTAALDLSAVDGTGAVVMSDLDNGFEVVLPVLAEALADGIPTT